MAEVNHFYAEQNTLFATTSTTWTDGTNETVRIEGASLAANTKYLIVARALLAHISTTNKGYIRVTAADDTTIETKSEAVIEFADTNDVYGWSYLFVHSFSTDASPAAVVLDVQTEGNTVKVDQMSLLLIDLDDLGSANYFEDINAVSGTELSTTQWGTTLAQIAGADLGTTEEWLVLGYARVDLGSATRNYELRLTGADDSASASSLGEVQEEGEDTAEQRVQGFTGRHKAVTSNVALSIEGSEEAANANHLDGGSYLIAIKASAFADFQHDYNAGTIEFTNTSQEYQSNTIASYTPTTTGNHLILHQFNKSVASNTHISGDVEDGGTLIRTGEDGMRHDQRWDTTVNRGKLIGFQRYSITTTSTFDLDGETREGSPSTVHHRWLILLNLNLAATGTVVPVAVTARTFGMPAVTVEGGAVDVQGVIARNITPEVVAAKGAARSEPAAIARSVGVPATTQVGGGVVVPAVTARNIIPEDVTLVIPRTIEPGAIARIFTVDDVTVKGAAKSEPSQIVTAGLMPAPTAVGSAVDVQAVINRNIIPEDATAVSGDGGPATVTPDAIARAFTVDAATPKGAATTLPAVIARNFGVNDVTVVGRSIALPGAIAQSFTVDAPTVKGSAVTTPATIARDFLIPQVTVFNTDGGSATVTPDAIARAFAVDDVTVKGGAVLTPSVIARSLGVNGVTPVGSGEVSPATTARSFDVNAPTIVGGAVVAVPLTSGDFLVLAAAPVSGDPTTFILYYQVGLYEVW
jgi:hypothetical protein